MSAVQFNLDRDVSICEVCGAKHKNNLVIMKDNKNDNANNYGTFTFFPQAKKVVSINGENIALTPQEYKLLEFGLSNLGKAIARQEILNTIWGNNTIVVPTTLRNRISKLRRKLNLNDKLAKLEIVTLTGVGYRFDLKY